MNEITVLILVLIWYALGAIGARILQKQFNDHHLQFEDSFIPLFGPLVFMLNIMVWIIKYR